MKVFLMYKNSLGQDSVSNPQFKSREFFYQEIKKMPNTKCACCGRELITGEDIRNAYAKITLPLSKMIKDGFLDKFRQFPNIWQTIVALADRDKNASFDEIVLDKDNYMFVKEAVANHFKTPKVREQIEKNPDEKFKIDYKITDMFKNIETASRAVLQNISVVMKELARFKPSLNGSKLETFEQLERYAAKYPEMRLSEVLAIPEIRDFHVMKDFLQRAETREIMNYHFDNIEKMIKEAAPEVTEEELKELRTNIIKRYNDEKDPMARTYYAKKDYKNFLNRHNCAGLEDKVNEEVEKLPRTYITKDSFLAFASNHHYYDSAITYSFIINASSSVDHKIARSKGGEDLLKNYSVMCRECNKRKGDREFEEQLAIHPEMIENEKQQILDISQYIISGHVHSSLKHWPIEAAKTAYRLSGGKINVNLVPYCKQELVFAEERLQKHKEEMNNLYAQRAPLARQIKSLQETDKNSPQLKDMHEQMHDINKQIRVAQSKLQKERDFIKNLKNIISTGSYV